MELYQLRGLIAFAECGNLSKAAEAVHTSQSALSRSMKNLEDELGVPLFFYVPKTVSLLPKRGRLPYAMHRLSFRHTTI